MLGVQLGLEMPRPALLSLRGEVRRGRRAAGYLQGLLHLLLPAPGSAGAAGQAGCPEIGLAERSAR